MKQERIFDEKECTRELYPIKKETYG